MQHILQASQPALIVLPLSHLFVVPTTGALFCYPHPREEITLVLLISLPSSHL